MGNFADRLREAQIVAANTRAKNIAEAHAMIETVAETLVSSIETEALKGISDMLVTAEISEKQIFAYTKLVGLSMVSDGLLSLKEALREQLEGIGSLQIDSTALSGVKIVLTVHSA